MKDVKDFINDKIQKELDLFKEGKHVVDPNIEKSKNWTEDQLLQKKLNDLFNEDQPVLFFNMTPIGYNKGIEINWDYVNTKRGKPIKSSDLYINYLRSIVSSLKERDYKLFDDQPIHLKIEIYTESAGNDLDNLEKPIIDAICRHYGINDNKIKKKESFAKKTEKGEGQFLVQFLKITELELQNESLLKTYNSNSNDDKNQKQDQKTRQTTRNKL